MPSWSSCAASKQPSWRSARWRKPTFRKEDDYQFITGTGIEAAYGISKMFSKAQTGSALVQWGMATGFSSRRPPTNGRGGLALPFSFSEDQPMTGTLNNNVSARDIGYGVVQFLRKRIVYTQTGAITIGVIPAGSLILKPLSGVMVNVITNAGTNNRIDIGTSADDDLYGT